MLNCREDCASDLSKTKILLNLLHIENKYLAYYSLGNLCFLPDIKLEPYD